MVLRARRINDHLHGFAPCAITPQRPPKRAPVRMVGLHGLTFIRPVREHAFIPIRSAVAHTAPESLTVLINVDAERPLVGEHEETLRAFLSYQPIDPRTRVPPLECLGDDEHTVFDEAAHRLALQRSIARDEADSES